jgi:hypothetical protein
MNKYLECRDMIGDGDILFFYKGKNIFSKITETLTNGPFCHAGVAFNLHIPGTNEKRVFIVEQQNGGQRIITLSSCIDNYTGFYLMKNPVQWDLYGPELVSKSGFIKYSYLDLSTIWVREQFGIKLKDYTGEVCSEMIAKILIKHGVQLKTSMVSPNQLYRDLTNLGIESTYIDF